MNHQSGVGGARHVLTVSSCVLAALSRSIHAATRALSQGLPPNTPAQHPPRCAAALLPGNAPDSPETDW